MKRFFLSMVLSVSFLFAGAFNLSSDEKKQIENVLQNSVTDSYLANKLLTQSTKEGGWENSDYKYLYKVKTTDGDKLGFFIIKNIYNQNFYSLLPNQLNITNNWNIQEGFAFLVDANSAQKLVWNGYSNIEIKKEYKLYFSMERESILESGSTKAWVWFDNSLEFPRDVKFTQSGERKANIPLFVTIPAGDLRAEIEIKGKKDTIIENDGYVNITATSQN